MIPYIDGGQNIVIHKSWRMNERHYGALTGLSKDTVQFTPTFTGRPPPMESTHPRWQIIAAHPAYAELIANDTMPRTESLKDTYDRMFPYWVSTIIPEMQTKKRIIVVSHENALRSLMKYIDKIDGIEAATLKLRQCGLYIYEFDKNMNVVVSRHYVDWANSLLWNRINITLLSILRSRVILFWWKPTPLMPNKYSIFWSEDSGRMIC